MAYTTLVDIKDWLEVEGTTSDSLLASLINVATEKIDNYCGRDFSFHTGVSEVLLSEWRDSFVLKYYPVTSITSVNVGDYQEYSNLEVGIIRFTPFLYPFYGQLEITYNAGYTQTPYTVVQVCKELCELAWSNRKHIGVSSESISGYSFSADLDSEERVLRKLDNYRDIIRYK